MAALKLCVVAGTRPETIKVAPILWELARRGIPHVFVHTGQHYSHALREQAFLDLRLAPPHVSLSIGGSPVGHQLAQMTPALRAVLARERPSAVIVQGDTNSALAGALAASAEGVPLAHVEAGLRSFDNAMVEELNRIVADSISDFLFAPTDVSRANLLAEGHDPARITVTGNTCVDALAVTLPLARSQSTVHARLGLAPRGYTLATLHRPELVDQEERLRAVIEGLTRLGASGRQIVFPVHPRTLNNVRRFGLEPALRSIPRLVATEPLGYLDFLVLQADAALIVSDSGGIQEESCVLGVPCVTVRESTERTESVDVGASVLVGHSAQAICDAATALSARTALWLSPYGDGRAAVRILDTLCAADLPRKAQR